MSLELNYDKVTVVPNGNGRYKITFVWNDVHITPYMLKLFTQRMKDTDGKEPKATEHSSR